MTSLVPRRKHGFSSAPLHPKREPHPIFFLKQRSSFWIATLSVGAFLIGNMIGQNGWYLFLASVLGKEDDSLIVYTGTVTPLEKVPDYSRWMSYGGNAEEHTYRQVPQDLLVVLPVYDQSAQLRTENASTSAGFYSVGNRGSYSTGAENSGSHPGVDIRAPMGSPVRAVANGIVEEVKQGGGFGLVIVIRHPNVPDPDRPNRTTTLYSAYAHLQAALVTVGTLVEKGEHIAFSGQSGYASGPHLHFQIDRESAPFHPYWPFTDAEAGEAGLTLAEAVDAGFHSERLKQYTVHPMLYVQANFLPVPVTPGTTEVVEKPKPVVLNLSQRIALRLQSRKEKQEQEEEVEEVREETPPVLAPAAPEQVVVQREPEAEEVVPAVRMSRSQRAAQDRQKRVEDRVTRARFSSRQVSRTQETVVRREEVATQGDISAVIGGPQQVQDISIQHDGSYSGRGWEQMVVQLTDEEGALITNPALNRDIYLRAIYGDAEFRPSVLTALDFSGGEAMVYMLPRGRTTIVIQAQPYPAMSSPMAYGQ